MRILLPVDGSDQSFDATRALQHFVPLQEVIVLYVVEVPPPYPLMMPDAARKVYLDAYQAMDCLLREEGEKVLTQAASFLPPHVGHVSRRLETGKPTDLILATAEKSRVGLIVLGARGLGPVRELIFGSVSHGVVSHTPCAVLVVKKPLRSLTRILLAVEEKRDAESALRFLTALPFKEPPEVIVLNAPPFLQPVFVGKLEAEAIAEQARAGAQHFVDELASRLSSQYRTRGVVRVGPPPVTIIQEAEASKPDLIVVGSHAREGLGRFLLGSVSHAVLHRAACPVLILR